MRKVLSWAGIAALVAVVGYVLATGLVTRSFTIAANTDGTINSAYPNGDKAAGESCAWNVSGLASLENIEVGTPTNRQVRQFLTCTTSAITTAATISIVTVSGDDPATEGMSISGDNLVHTGLQTGSGVIRLRAAHASITNADSGTIPWSYIPQAPVTPTDWEYDPATDGLDVGTGAGDWVGFQSVTLQADDATVISDGYLQLTCGASTFAGISSHWATPTFTAGVSYTITITVASGTNWTGAVAVLNSGTSVALPVTAGAHELTLVAGSGGNALVIHANGGCTTGQVLRITSITQTSVADVFDFQQSSYSGLETDSSIAYCAIRTLPSNNAATLNVAITTGGSLATNNNAQLSWIANEGGAKCGSIDPSADGLVVLTISSPSVGVLGTQTTTNVTINPVTSGLTYPRLGTLDLQITLTANAAQIAKYALRHVVVITGWPEVQSWRGVSNQSIAAQIKAASTIGTQVYIYVDPEGAHKPQYFVYQTHYAKITAQNWFLYTIGASGTPLDSYFDNSKHVVNITSVTAPDGSGLQAPQWFASHMASWLHNGGEGNTVAPDLNGPFYDNILHIIRVSGDWDRDLDTDFGGEDTSLPENVAYRQGLSASIDYYKTNNPTRTILGNDAECVARSNIQAEVPQYYRKLHGGLIEHAIALDATFSPDTFLPFSTLVARLQACEDNFLNPELGMVGSWAKSGTTFNSSSWLQQHRYGLAVTTVATNMTFYWSRGSFHEGNLDYYPEYGSLGEYGATNLGTASQARQTSPITSHCAYRRNFANGTVIVWPNGCTTAVTLGATYYALSGTGAAWLTPGQAVTSVTPPSGRNAIFLRATAP